MYKKCKCILLDSGGRTSNLIKSLSDNILRFQTGTFCGYYQHLYIVSLEEEIKKGNWYFWNNSIDKCETIYEANDLTNNCNKIIASTDSSLNLPSVPQSFIEHYINQYNKGNRIEDAMVEYEEFTETDYSMGIDSSVLVKRPKIKSDNTISIKDAKSSWSRKELRPIMLKLCYDTYDYLNDSEIRTNFNIDEWMNENL